MKTRLSTPTALIAGLLLLGCQPQEPETEAQPTYEAPDFSAMNEAYAAAVNAGDAEALGMMYAEDAISMPPNAEPLVGRQAIVDDAAEDFASLTANLVSQTEGHYMMGDTAIEWGRYAFTGTLNESGATISEEGKYVAIWKHQPDGSWQIVRDIWNANAPPTMETAGEMG
ncbi:MAG: nuclear transport factor 2 family protein [Gemmatimonadota bacterium]|jgi:ketosteroid isomerase-like protein|nr:MAG: nuclear transport factor 2 family protein [Gemmatimonadota bacterium]